jgi:hypothetical protein
MAACMRPTGPPPRLLLPASAGLRIGAASFLGGQARHRRGCGRRLVALGRGIELEEGDLLIHRLGLVLQRLGGGRVLLDQRRVLLRHLVHLGECLVDLIDPGRLLLTRRSDLRHNVGDLLDRGENLGE